MLKIIIPGIEGFDDDKEEFFETPSIEVELEHCLFAVSKWESIHKKAFLSESEKTPEELLDYVRCMNLTAEIPIEAYKRIRNCDMDRISEYIADPMSATHFTDLAFQGMDSHTKETMTSEYLYYIMISANVPLECQYWHLNRLVTLLKIFSVKNRDPKAGNTVDDAAARRARNAQNKARLETKG